VDTKDASSIYLESQASSRPFGDTFFGHAMTSMNRTAYPLPGEQLTEGELQSRYTLTEQELWFLQANARGNKGRVALATILKTRQNFGGFFAFDEVSPAITKFLALQLSLPALPVPEVGHRMVYRHREAVRVFLGVMSFGTAGEELVAQTVLVAAETMSDPADLINRGIEALRDAAIDLPAFSTLERIANHVRQQVHERIFELVSTRLTNAQSTVLEALLVVPADAITTPFNRLEQWPGPARAANIKMWIDRAAWLNGLPDPEPLLLGISHTKVRQFGAEAAALEVSELLDIGHASKRSALLLCFIQQSRARARDELVEMFLSRIRRTRTAAKEKLQALQDQHQGLEESLIAVFGEVLGAVKEEAADAIMGRQIRELLIQRGGLDHLSEQCKNVSAWHGNNDLPLIWPIHAPTRSLVFGLLEQMDVRAATQDRSLIDALDLVHRYRHARRDDLVEDIDLGFASGRWRSFVTKARSEGSVIDRRSFEVCVFIYVANALQTGDLYVVGSEDFADYRAQLLPWPECQPRLQAYCEALGMPGNGRDFVTSLKAELTAAAGAVDRGFPDNTWLTIDGSGTPHLKQMRADAAPEGMVAFEQEALGRMTERHLLDILKNAQHWSRYTRHFGAPSGSDPKLAQAVQRYLFAVFGYGCNLGPGQTARHAPEIVTSQTLRRINAQHITANKLEAAATDLIDVYARFSLPRHWGPGKAAIADGTHVPLRENNLLGSRHIRYGGYGGIAYHHIADNYIALFTTFIPCGVWEAVHILDGLLKNRSVIQPDTLHADTHGQSEPVFGLSRFLGIALMPRMRTWADIIFYRPSKAAKYDHVDTLFTGDIDWELIVTHWPDMMQVVLSIQAGLVIPSMLLRKLGTYNRKNRLYRAFRELGRVERSLFLLRYISDADVRRGIRAETTKVEAFNDFLDWVSFGGPIIKSGDPVGQEKQLKYATLIANAIMLSNVVDLTTILTEMAADGHPVTPEMVKLLSPYMRRHILRFGRYRLDMDDLPEPLKPTLLPFELAK